MKSLEEAQNWYGATKASLTQMKRLGDKHWTHASLVNASIWQDDDFKTLTAEQITEGTTVSLELIDDLAVVVLFSVFEAIVRDSLVDSVSPEAELISSPILKAAADDAIRGLAEGSFYRRILEPLKKQGTLSADLITQVDQVRDYRNWVAHGRRGVPTNNVTPKDAFERLERFLAALEIQ